MGEWIKSSFSNKNSTCVEVRFEAACVQLRDSKYEGDKDVQPKIDVPNAHWPEFLRAALLSFTTVNVKPSIHVDLDGSATLTASDGTVLSYSVEEWAVFLKGVQAGEFDFDQTSQR